MSVMQNSGSLINSPQSASGILTEQQVEQQQPQLLLWVSIDVIKLQLLPWLTNKDRGALFDSCRYLRPLKQTEFRFNFNRASSLRYATDAVFREQVHQSVAINEPLLLGKRMIDIDLKYNQTIADVSMLGEVMALDLSNCNGVRDVTGLGVKQMLNLSGCRNIENVDALKKYSKQGNKALDCPPVKWQGV